MPFDVQESSWVQQLRSEMDLLNLPPTSSIYVRGSRIEDSNHHPRADLDLTLISSPQDLKTLFNVVYGWAQASPIPIDIRKSTPAAIENDAHLRLLLHTRSLHVYGPEYTFRPVPANLDTIRCIFHQYAYYQFPAQLKGSFGLRLLQLKLITRSFGCIAFAQGFPFTRDIATCIQIAKHNDAFAGAVLNECWNRLCAERMNTELNVQPVIDLLLEREKTLALF